MCKKYDPFDFDSDHDWDNDGIHDIFDEAMDDIVRQHYFDEMNSALNPNLDDLDDEDDEEED